MARHTVSHAALLYRGDVFYDGYSPDGRRGLEFSHLYFWDLGAVEAADPNGICTAAANATPVGGTELVITGALATSGVATMTTPRNMVVVSSTTDTTQTALITGTDVYGEAMSEDIAFNGTTPVPGLKAFKTVTSVVIDITMAGNPDIGTVDVLGSPIRIETLNAVIQTTSAGVVDAPTLLVADDTTATTTTGDIRGTVQFTATPNAVIVFGGLLKVNNTYTKAEIFGVTQA